jgi:hypothetical protein
MPLEETGPDTAGLFGIEAVPGHATPDPSDASQPYLGQDEEVLEDVINTLRSALFGILPSGGQAIALTQPAWFVDSVNGKDTNDGKTQATAVRTILEIKRRYGPSPQLLQSTKITVLSATLLATDSPFFDGLIITDVGFTFTIVGTRFAGAVLGLITAVTAINHAVADGALYVTIGAIVWPAARTRVRIQGGPRDGAVAYVETPNTAAGQARLSPFTLIPPGTQFNMSAAQIVTPVANTDTLIIETVSRAQHPLMLHNTEIVVIIEDMRFDDDANFTFSEIVAAEDFSITMNRCSIGDGIEIRNASVVMNGCDLAGNINDGQYCNINASLVVGFFAEGVIGGSWALDLDTIFSACDNRGLVAAPALNIVAGNVAYYNNAAQPCITFFASGSYRHRVLNAVDAVLYGIGDQFVFKIRTLDGRIALQDPTLVRIVGTAGYASIAGKVVNSKLYGPDNKGNLITTPAADPSTPTGADVYPIAALHVARNAVVVAVANLNAFTVAGNDGSVNNVEHDTVVLLHQAALQANGPYLVGPVVLGIAQLFRPDWWQTAGALQQGSEISIAEGDTFGGCTLKSFAGAGKIIDTDDPVLIPDTVLGQTQLTNGAFVINNIPVRANTKAATTPSRLNFNGGALTIMYTESAVVAGALGAGSVTIIAALAAGGVNVADQSTLNWAVKQW